MALRAARFDLLELFSNLIRTLHHNAPEPEPESESKSHNHGVNRVTRCLATINRARNDPHLEWWNPSVPFFGKVVPVNMCDLVDVATAWTGEISGNGNFKIAKLMFSSTEIVHSDNR